MTPYKTRADVCQQVADELLPHIQHDPGIQEADIIEWADQEFTKNVDLQLADRFNFNKYFAFEEAVCLVSEKVISSAIYRLRGGGGHQSALVFLRRVTEAKVNE